MASSSTSLTAVRQSPRSRFIHTKRLYMRWNGGKMDICHWLVKQGIMPGKTETVGREEAAWLG